MLKKHRKIEETKVSEINSDYSTLCDDIISSAEEGEIGEILPPEEENSTENEENPAKEKRSLFRRKKKLPKEKKEKRKKKSVKQKKDDVKVFVIPERSEDDVCEESVIPLGNDEEDEIFVEEIEDGEEPLFPDEAFTKLIGDKDREEAKTEEEPKEKFPEQISKENSEKEVKTVPLLVVRQTAKSDSFSEKHIKKIANALETTLEPPEKEVEEKEEAAEEREIILDDLNLEETLLFPDGVTPEELVNADFPDEGIYREGETTEEKTSEKDQEEIQEETSNGKSDTEESEDLGPEHKWHNDTITTISDEHSVEVIPEEDLDDKLLLALGYKNADGEKLDPKRNVLREEKVFALEKEFSSRNEITYILDRFKTEKSRIERRFGFTLSIALVILFYPLIAGVLAGRIEFFDTNRFFSANAIVCMQFMLIAAAFSAKELLIGFLKVFSSKPDEYSPSAWLIAANCAGTVTYAFLAEPNTTLPVSLYTFFATVTLLIPIISDYVRVSAQRRTFKSLTSDLVFRLDRVGEEYVIRRGNYPSDIKSRTQKGVESSKVLAYTVLPSILLALIAGVSVLLIKDDISSAILTFLSFASLSFPAPLLLSFLPFYSVLNSKLEKENSAIIGRSTLDEIAAIQSISVSSDMIFNRNSATTLNVELFGKQNIHNVIDLTCSAVSSKNTPFATVFKNIIDETDPSAEAEIKEDTENGIGAMIRGRNSQHAVFVGNAFFMEEHNLKITKEELTNTHEGHTTPVFISIDGELSAFIAVDYAINEEFCLISDKAVREGIKLKIYTTDFCVTEELVAAKLHIEKSAFEIIRGSLPRSEELPSTVAVTNEDPHALLEIKDHAEAAISAEKAQRKIAPILFVILLALSAATAVFGIIASPLLMLFASAVITLPAVITAITLN